MTTGLWHWHPPWSSFLTSLLKFWSSVRHHGLFSIRIQEKQIARWCYHSHTPGQEKHLRILCIDYSSFNTIIPSKLIAKLKNLLLNTDQCNWILDFLMNRPQEVRIGNSYSTTLSMGAPKGSVLGPSCTPCSHMTVANFSSNIIFEFADTSI